MHPQDATKSEAGQHGLAAHAPPGERLIRLPELLSLTGDSRSQAYAKIAEGVMPSPIKDGRSSLWVLSEVQAYIARKIANAKRKA